MGAGDSWFRKESWSAADAAEFAQRLSKSRGQRTQYIKLQAWHLAQTRKRSLAAPAIRLANQYLEEDPSGSFEVQAHLIIAQANVTLGNTADALQAYRAAVRVESRKRGIRSCAYLAYAWFAATNGLEGEFDEVLKSMESIQEGDLVVPLSQYKYFASLALIFNELRDDESALRMARNALDAQARAAPFARHKNIGIVKNVHPSIQREFGSLPP